MRYPMVRYGATPSPYKLRLDCFDGMRREVVFSTVEDAVLARRPGRAESDCAAILQDRLPPGGCHVSNPVARDDDELALEIGDGDDEPGRTTCLPGTDRERRRTR